VEELLELVPVPLFLTHRVSKPDEMECKTWVIFIHNGKETKFITKLLNILD
jgi:hypothetical protein